MNDHATGPITFDQAAHELRKAARCLYLAVDTAVAVDVEKRVEATLQSAQSRERELREVIEAIMGHHDAMCNGVGTDCKDIETLVRRLIGKEGR